jgi:hypothetical protein
MSACSSADMGITRSRKKFEAKSVERNVDSHLLQPHNKATSEKKAHPSV